MVATHVAKWIQVPSRGTGFLIICHRLSWYLRVRRKLPFRSVCLALGLRAESLMQFCEDGCLKMAELIRQLTAPVDHGCVFLRDAESKETHSAWNPGASPVSWSEDSLLFAVQPAVDGPVEFEIWKGEGDGRLADVLFEGSIRLLHGRLIMHDPNDDFRIELAGLGHGGGVVISADHPYSPARVKIDLLF